MARWNPVYCLDEIGNPFHLIITSHNRGTKNNKPLSSPLNVIAIPCDLINLFVNAQAADKQDKLQVLRLPSILKKPSMTTEFLFYIIPSRNVMIGPSYHEISPTEKFSIPWSMLQWNRFEIEGRGHCFSTTANSVGGWLTRFQVALRLALLRFQFYEFFLAFLFTWRVGMIQCSPLGWGQTPTGHDDIIIRRNTADICLNGT